MQNYFNVQDEWNMEDTKINRKKALQVLGRRLKDYKNFLVKNFFRKNKPPADKYKISKEQWRIFCSFRKRKDWEVIVHLTFCSFCSFNIHSR